MPQYNINALDAETSSQHSNVRFSELDAQHWDWDRDKSSDLAHHAERGEPLNRHGSAGR